jgi:hypothetical protein
MQCIDSAGDVSGANTDNLMEQSNEIVLRDRAEKVVERCRRAKAGSLAEMTVAIAEGIVWVAEWEIKKLTKQIKALGVVMKDRSERGRGNG